MLYDEFKDVVTLGGGSSYRIKMQPGTLYIAPFGTGKEAAGIVSFICPCGCGKRHNIPVNRVTKLPDTPEYTMELDKEGTATIAPHISHELDAFIGFTITNNAIEWVKDGK